MVGPDFVQAEGGRWTPLKDFPIAGAAGVDIATVQTNNKKHNYGTKR
jgi:hypothetical protein